MFRRLLVVGAVLALMVATLPGSSAMAAKGGKNVRVVGPSAAALVVAPSAVSPSASYTVSGSGFTPGATVIVFFPDLDDAHMTLMAKYATADTSGNFAFQGAAPTSSGNVKHDAWELRSTEDLVLITSATLAVE